MNLLEMTGASKRIENYQAMQKREPTGKNMFCLKTISVFGLLNQEVLIHIHI
jgi:hypothetical protein